MISPSGLGDGKDAACGVWMGGREEHDLIQTTYFQPRSCLSSFEFLRQLALGLSTGVLLLKMSCQVLPTSH